MSISSNFFFKILSLAHSVEHLQ